MDHIKELKELQLNHTDKWLNFRKKLNITFIKLLELEESFHVKLLEEPIIQIWENVSLSIVL